MTVNIADISRILRPTKRLDTHLEDVACPVAAIADLRISGAESL